jgi:hypothetical protein
VSEAGPLAELARLAPRLAWFGGPGFPLELVGTDRAVAHRASLSS